MTRYMISQIAVSKSRVGGRNARRIRVGRRKENPLFDPPWPPADGDADDEK